MNWPKNGYGTVPLNRLADRREPTDRELNERRKQAEARAMRPEFEPKSILRKMKKEK